MSRGASFSIAVEAIAIVVAATLGIAVLLQPVRAMDAAGADFSGHWVLNEEASDDVLRKMEEAHRERHQGGFRGGSGSAGGGRGGGDHGGLFPPGALPPRGQGGSREGELEGPRAQGASRSVQGLLGVLMATEMVVEQGDDRVVVKVKSGPSAPESERIFAAGAGKVEDVLEGDVKRTVVSDWKKDGSLVVKTKLQREMGSTQSTETWRLSDEGGRLVVDLEASGGPLQGVEIRRVYDRAPASVPSAAGAQALPSLGDGPEA